MTALIFAAACLAFILAFSSATWAAYSTRALNTAAHERATNHFIIAQFLTILFAALGGAGAMWCLS